MLIGIVGAPNKGKSTIFSAMTMSDAEIADYPFTTIKPNLGVAYVTKICPEKELGAKCTPRNSLCRDGVRYVPVNVTDVAGLVPDAHLGKGMGTQFLNDLIESDVLIQVIDASGGTDVHGKPGKGCDQAEDVEMVAREMANWLAGIIEKHMDSISKSKNSIEALAQVLSGFKPSEEELISAAEENGLTTTSIFWNHESAYKFAESFLASSKPTVIAANKLDKAEGSSLEKLKSELDGYAVIGCSAAIELALKKADKAGVISYAPGSGSFEIRGGTEEQRKALGYMQDYLKRHGSTGVIELLNNAVFESVSSIVVYPVENEHKYSDHQDRILPDAILMRKGSTAHDLARKIHTEIADKMIHAVDARTKKRLAKDYVLNDGDVIKIVTAAKS